MTLNYESMFESVQKAIVAKDNAKAAAQLARQRPYKEVFKPQVGGEYVLRIIPSEKGGSNILESTFFNYIQYSWQHMITDKEGKPKVKWEMHQSPRTFHERCPISAYDNLYRRSATKEQVDEYRKKINFRSGHYINVYVVKDSTNSDNEGKIKILDCPNDVWTFIDGTLHGDKDEEYSENVGHDVQLARKVINLSSEGINLVIKVTPDEKRKTPKGNPMPVYSTIRWSLRNTDLGLDGDEQKKLIDSAYDLSTVNFRETYDGLAEVFEKTFLPKLGPEAPAMPPKPESTAPASEGNVVVKEEKNSLPPIDDEPPALTPIAEASGEIDTVGDVDSFLDELDLG